MNRSPRVWTPMGRRGILPIGSRIYSAGVCIRRYPRPREQTTQALDWIFGYLNRIDLAVRIRPICDCPNCTAVRTRRRNPDRDVWIHPDRPRGRHLAGLDHAAVEKLLPYLRARNAHGGDIYWRPARGDAVLILLDDLGPRLGATIARKCGSPSTVPAP